MMWYNIPVRINASVLELQLSYKRVSISEEFVLNKIITLKIDGSTNHVEITNDLRSSLKDLFSGCRVNFLLGAGFSAEILGLLDNKELFLKQFGNIVGLMT